MCQHLSPRKIDTISDYVHIRRMTMTRMHFPVPAELLARFKEACRSVNVPMNKVIIAIMQRELDEPDELARRDKSGERMKRLAERAAMIDDVVSRAKLGERYDAIAADHGISKSGVSKIVTRYEARNAQ